MLRVVLDSNVFVSSLLNKQGAPAQVLDAWRKRLYLLVVSEAILVEVLGVLAEPRLRSKYCLEDQDIAQLEGLFRQEALLVPGQADVTGAIPADPQDEKFLACAVDGLADVIVSGDRHLLDLGSYQGIPILTVRQFLDLLSRGRA